MKINDLLVEARVDSLLRSEARSVLVSNVWDATWNKEHTKFGDLTQELLNLLLDKCWFDPPPAAGKKDYPFGGANIPDLRGIWHAHMHFGKVVIVYQAEANSVRLYIAGDHKMVEAGHLALLGTTVKRLKKGTWTQVATPQRQIIDDITPHVQKAAQEWFALLADDAAMNAALYKFSQDKRNLLPLLPYIDYQPVLKHVPVDSLQKLAVAFLKQS